MTDPSTKLRRMSASCSATEAHALTEAAEEIDAAVLAFDKEGDIVGGVRRMVNAIARADRVYGDVVKEPLVPR